MHEPRQDQATLETYFSRAQVQGGEGCIRGVRSRWSNCGVCPQLAGHEHLKQRHSVFLPPLSFPIVILIILESLPPHPQLLNPLLLHPPPSLPSSSSFRPPSSLMCIYKYPIASSLYVSIPSVLPPSTPNKRYTYIA
eukprot:714069-Pyramimonas_sp.AAC.1